jgi:glutamate-5-semialdehyde dehydrogenase
LAARRVPRGVDEFDVDPADRHDVARFVELESGLPHTRRALDPRRLGPLNVDGHIASFQEAFDALDTVAHHVPPDVIGVIVRGQYAGDAHTVGLGDVDDLVDRVRRVDHEAITRRSITDEVHEVHHLLGQAVIGREVSSGQQLAHVERVGRHEVDDIGAPSHVGQNGGMLDRLVEGQIIPYGGRYTTVVDGALAESFRAGDRLVVVQESGTLLHVPADDHRVVTAAVDAAVGAFAAVRSAPATVISSFFESFAERVADDTACAPVLAANEADVERARERGRSTTRLVLDAKMRSAMIDGLRGWASAGDGRGNVLERVEHPGFTVESVTAPLGVVAFVFEGRPNVFADATGVLRNGNSVVFRIGSDALGTARAIVEHLLGPALDDAGLPRGAVTLVDAASHASAWALFSDPRLSLAVARGSGPAVAQLGAVARQAGVPVSLHGTGGAWVLVGASADPDRLRGVVDASLDRKVCNTLNTCCVVRERAAELVPVVLAGLTAAAERRGAPARLHVVGDAASYVPTEWFERRVEVVRAEGICVEPVADIVDVEVLATEWEWEHSPEMTLVLVDRLEDAVMLCNEFSPHFVVSVVTGDVDEEESCFELVDAPFFGNGYTRWVDGQYAFGRPELGLSNWEGGRLLGRSGILSGDSVHSVRVRVRQSDPRVRR